MNGEARISPGIASGTEADRLAALLLRQRLHLRDGRLREPAELRIALRRRREAALLHRLRARHIATAVAAVAAAAAADTSSAAAAAAAAIAGTTRSGDDRWTDSDGCFCDERLRSRRAALDDCDAPTTASAASEAAADRGAGTAASAAALAAAAAADCHCGCCLHWGGSTATRRLHRHVAAVATEVAAAAGAAAGWPCGLNAVGVLFLPTLTRGGPGAGFILWLAGIGRGCGTPPFSDGAAPTVVFSSSSSSSPGGRGGAASR